ncbi:helix-turn-helix domain-containing protein [Elioraea sp.]|uniref:helix-turn-helix domain-containing protein n=1 Tax=Elioraea sp. TaxID=2185103 RepID=UPI003F73052D
MHHDGHTTLIENPTTLTMAAPSAVGGLLRATRMRHGLSLNDVSAALRIRRDYLDAIEHGRADALPAPAYAIGFVRSYAAALGLDAEEVSRRYRAETGLAAKRKPELTFPAPVPERGVPAGALVVVGVMLAAALYGGWYYLTDTGQRLADVVPALPERLARIETTLTSPPAVPVPPGAPAAPAMTARDAPPAAPLPASPVPVDPTENPRAVEPPLAALPPAPAVTLPPTGAWPTGPAVTPQSLLPARRPDPSAANATPVAGAPTEAAPPATPAEPPPGEPASYGATGSEAGRVLLRARADTWIQVRERGSGSVLFNRVLRPGETYRVPERAGLMMTTGNAGGLEVMVAGDALPSLGGQGVVRRDLPLDPAALRQAVAALPR